MESAMSFQDWCIQNHAYLLLYFYYEGKNPIPPDKIGFSSRKRVRFQCHVCGLSWQRTLNTISNHPTVQTCPFCTHRKPSPFYNLATEYPEVSKEWNYTKNKGQKLEDFSPHSNQKVWWTCSYDPSRQWQAKICNRTSLCRGCPQCAKEFKMSYPARALFYYLRKAYPSCVCEEPFQKYKMDLFLPDINLVLEHDGYYRHNSETDQKRAERKDYALRKAGYQVLRICDSKDLTDPVVLQDTKILYRHDEREPHKSNLRAPIKKCGGSALSVVTAGRHLLTADFLRLPCLCPETPPHIFLNWRSILDSFS